MTYIQETGSSPEPGQAKDSKAFKAALAKARRLCASRECCKKDIADRLTKWQLTDEPDISRLTDILVAEGYIDEGRYARAFAGDRLRYNKWGRIKIAYTLRSRAIPGEIIDAAIQDIDETEYEEIALALIRSLLRTGRNEDPYRQKARILRSMYGRGFESSLTGSLYDSLTRT